MSTTIKDPEMQTQICVQNIIAEEIEIMKHYKCSETCNGWCCKVYTVTFTKKDYFEIFSHVNPEIKQILRKNTRKIKFDPEAIILTDEPQFRKLIEKPCPLMTKNSRCGMYDNRPDVCQLYPFVTHNVLENNTIVILPCDMGVEIGLDSIYYTIEYVSVLRNRDEISEEQFREAIAIILRHTIVTYREKVDPKILEDSISSVFVIPAEFLSDFKKYVVTTSEEVRKQRCHAITMFIEKHLTDENPVSEQEIFDFVHHWRS
ncbi:YkgJ family cysteine cluster protein [Methanosarcina sp.]|uniref:YkgJ family cysteine cluster protein n=1 Tax=Methanosarcina sp. TaxID=2213 RepID=UPI003BB6B895